VERAWHQVTWLGRGGGDVGATDVVLLAVPGTAVEVALSSVVGREEETVLDATNLYGSARPHGRVLLQRRVREVGDGRADGESVLHQLFAIAQSGLGQFVYWLASPEQL
jgi:hypothetical protein